MAQGEMGESIVKGDEVMTEYYRNPEKTVETIKKGWLYTGDMAKMETKDSFTSLTGTNRQLYYIRGTKYLSSGNRKRIAKSP